MASTSREPTTTVSQSSRLPPAAAPSPFHTPSQSYKPTSTDQLSAAQDPLKPGASPGSKALMTSAIELTGSAAIEENRRHEEELKKQQASMTSPNPAKTALLSGPTEGISRPSDAPSQPPTGAATSRPEPRGTSLPPPESSTVVAEPMEIDGPENDAVMTSSPGRTTSSAAMSENVSRSGSKKRPASPTSSRNDERVNKSYTYPPPPDHEPVNVVRNMSLPNSGTKSSVKKHRCPHCETEFTRHHNLKSHLLTHSQEKPYPCEQCKQRFRRLHDLKRHLKLHTGERPHECSICKRKFARGDALARHNKGPGGCAGRRESGAGEDDLSDLRGDDDTDEPYPPGEDYEGLENEEDADGRQRRRSEPNKRNRRSSGRANSTSSDFRHSGTTYPPVAPALAAPRRADMLPPGSSSTSQPREASLHHLSPHPHGAPSFSSVHYNGPSSMYAQSGMTESPKPLSPGNSDPHRRNSDMRPRSPSLATKLQQQHLPRGSTGGTPPINLPPPVSTHQQLPSISGIDPRFSSSSSSGRPPPVSTQMGSGSSGPPSATSQHQSSGGSGRDVYGAPQSSWQDETRMKDYVRSVEMRLVEEMTARAAERDERDKIIRSQQDELNALRNQLAHIEGRQDSISSQHRRSH